MGESVFSLDETIDQLHLTSSFPSILFYNPMNMSIYVNGCACSCFILSVNSVRLLIGETTWNSQKRQGWLQRLRILFVGCSVMLNIGWVLKGHIKLKQVFMFIKMLLRLLHLFVPSYNQQDYCISLILGSRTLCGINSTKWRRHSNPK